MDWREQRLEAERELERVQAELRRAKAERDKLNEEAVIARVTARFSDTSAAARLKRARVFE